MGALCYLLFTGVALQDTACSQEDLETVLNLEAREWETGQEENRFWSATLISAYSSRYYRLVNLFHPAFYLAKFTACIQIFCMHPYVSIVSL